MDHQAGDAATTACYPCGSGLPCQPHQQKPRGEKTSAPSTARLDGYLDKITQVAYGDKSQLQEVMKDIPISEIPALLTEWRKRAGFSGLDYSQKELMKNLIAQWYEQDAHNALAWLAALELKTDRNLMTGAVLHFEAGRDWDRALAIAEQFGSREEDGLPMPEELYRKLGECDAPLVMKILQAFSRHSGGTNGIIATFKADFDFAAMGQMLIQAKAADANSRYQSFPVNFSAAWAEQNSTAAWDWIVKNPEMAPYADLKDVFSQLSKALGVKAANLALIDAVRDPERGKVNYRRAWQSLQRNGNAEQISDFIGQLPGQRIEHLEELAENVGGSSFHYELSHEAFIQAMTPEELMLIVPKKLAKRHVLEIQKTARVLKALGHSQAEIAAMLPSEPASH
jgi:hypothetical protein